MPELPEVETIRRDLEKRIVGHKITEVEIRDRKIIKNDGAKFQKELVGNEIKAVWRRGKLLMFEIKSNHFLLTHLKMTGQLIYKNHQKITAGGHSIGDIDFQAPNKFTRVIISFAGGGKLFFNDMRRFGYMKIVDAHDKDRIWQKDFGIEPLTPSFIFADFRKIFIGRKTNVKALLMNQKLIAGIGNIYADEACFCARVLPWRKVGSLTELELKKLFQCITKVLQVAVKNRGTTFNDFVDGDDKSGGHYNFLNVYERDGEKCRRCKTIIKKTRHAGRGTHYCVTCQR